MQKQMNYSFWHLSHRKHLERIRFFVSSDGLGKCVEPTSLKNTSPYMEHLSSKSASKAGKHFVCPRVHIITSWFHRENHVVPNQWKFSESAQFLIIQIPPNWNLNLLLALRHLEIWELFFERNMANPAIIPEGYFSTITNLNLTNSSLRFLVFLH